MRIHIGALAAACAVSLAACGGGGGAAIPAGTTFNLDTLFSTALTQGLNASNLNASYNGTAYSAALSITPNGTTTFQGQSVQQSTQTVVVYQNNAQIGTATRTILYTSNPYSPVAVIDGSGGVSIPSVIEKLPTAEIIGHIGYEDAIVSYTDSSLGTVASTATGSWSLTQAANGNALACLNSTPIGASSASDAICLLVAPDGSIQGAAITLSVNGQTITFQ